MKPFDKKEKSDCSASDDSPPQRPKRNTCQKSAGGTNGLLWREETDLKKALYASLQENKKRGWDEDGEEENPDEEEQNPQPEAIVENGVEESPKKAKVHAQRKFAQGSTPTSPVLTPQKIPVVNNSTTQLLPYKRPKTEDFLTFLCLRGTTILPPSLDFLNNCSKSDTSSECRSISPELQEYSSKAPTTKNADLRERNCQRHDGVENGLPRKIGACRASSKRYSDTSPVKKLNFPSSKLNKVALSSKKKKLRDENYDPSSKSLSSSKAKATGLNALREKYKKQRLAADKKKLLPAKSSSNSTPPKKVNVAQNNTKPPAVTSKSVSHKKKIKDDNITAVPKTKLSKIQKKLAVEKRKSLRSADSRPRRLASLKKKTPWIRRAKLVPPIVDVESDSSEPEIIHTTPVKKVSSATTTAKKLTKSNNICKRLRSKQDAPKVKNRLTSRQILLRKHMQSRLKAKKSILHTKNVRSRAIVKRTAKQTILKQVKKNFVVKTMSLRKDLQNKRVTRSAKHQIEEMLWSNPEKRARVPNQKPVTSAKSAKKKHSNENQSAISRKTKSMTVKAKESVKVSKTSKDALKKKSHSNSPTEKVAKPASKVSEMPNPTKISRRSLSRDEKPGPSGTIKSDNHRKSNVGSGEIKINKSSTQIDSKKESKMIHNVSTEETTKTKVSATPQISVSKQSKTNDNSNSKALQSTPQTSTSSSAQSKTNDSSKSDSSYSAPQASDSTPKPSKSNDSSKSENLHSTLQASDSTPKQSKNNNNSKNNSTLPSAPQSSSSASKNSKTSDSLKANSLPSTPQSSTSASKEFKTKASSLPSTLQASTSTSKELKTKANSLQSIPQASISASKEIKTTANSLQSTPQASTSASKEIKTDNLNNLQSAPQLNIISSKESKTSDNFMKSNVNSEFNTMEVKVNLEKGLLNKLDIKEIDKTILWNASNSNIFGNDKNVQNNLNLLEPEKTSSKDISNLIVLNVNCEEPSYSQNCDPCFSGITPIKEKNVHNVKDSKEDAIKEVNSNQDHKVHKKSHDKKYMKKSSKEEIKLHKRNAEKDKSKKSEKSDAKSPKKHKERSSNKDDVNNDIKKSCHKKEGSKYKSESYLECDVKKSSVKSNEKKNKVDKNHIDLDNKSSEKSHKKDSFRDKSLTDKFIKQSNDGSKISSVQKKDLNCTEVRKENNENVLKNSDGAISTMNIDKKIEYDIHQPSCSKNEPNNVINSSSSFAARETDDDSDYDLTLDQFIKLNVLKNAAKSHSAGTTHVKEEASNSTKSSFDESKNFKLFKKESDKDVHKPKKDGESKHKRDKESSKSKSHDKDQKTPKKEDKVSKKDSEKSLAKLLKKGKLKLSKKEEKNKHKKDSSSSKSSKRDAEKDVFKSVKREFEDLANLGESCLEYTESKKEKIKKESKISRSSSCDETKSPKKKKKHNEFKDIEKIKNLISKSSILSEFSGFKEFKRRSSSDKSDLKKSKKRKKLALLREKKLSKKISSKLLRKYSKKKGLKSKKNKLKKKELKEMKIADLESKLLAKSKKQKHKTKSDHHGKDNVEKVKNIEASVSVTTSKTVNINSTSETAQLFAKVSESQCVSFTNTSTDMIINNSQTCTSSTSTVPTYIIESVPEVIPSLETMSTQISQAITAPAEQYMFGTTDELQGIVASDFTGVFEETFPSGAILLATRDTISQVPLHFIQDISVPKTMADAATNTGEDDIEENVEVVPESLRNDEMSVGTQTISPACSPCPTVELTPLVLPQEPKVLIEPVIDNVKSVKSNPVPSVSSVTIPVKTVPTVVTPSKSNVSHVINDAASISPKPKRRSSFIKKSKTPSIVLPKGQPFPLDSAKMVTAPVYYPTVEEFRDPLEYIYKIQGEAAQFGICKIVPPSSFKPECKVNDDMRFTAHNQYLHKMLRRWGPNVQHTACIKKHLKSQKVKLEQAPLIGGIELDISRFYHTVQQYGGLQQVIEKKKWQRVADALRVPKTAQDRVTKLYDAYCRYLVSFDTLPVEEKEKLLNEVISDHEKHVKIRNSPKDLDKEEEEFDDDENNDCVSKGRSMSLSNFFRIARNTMNMWFKNAPSPEEVEHEYWRVVTESQQHIVVHAGNIDSSVYQSGFACSRNSPFAKHPWNLKILTNNSSSILRCMGPVSGITIPTLHVGMLFTTGCWYRDPHSLPWIEYLHTGASKIWYSIPAKGCIKFRESMKKIMPEYCTNNPIWLPSDTAMVPPELLVKNGASLSRTIQNSGQFVVIFPESFTSTICCGYCVSESVYFAPTSWLDLAVKAFQDIQSSSEPPAFSLERLLLSIANDPKTQPETLQKILPLIQDIRSKEMQLRSQLSELGLKQWERLPLLDTKDKKKKSRVEDECEQECEVCRTHCYISMVVYTQEETIYCLPHTLEHIPKKNLKLCKLMYTYDENELKELEKKIVELISVHLAKVSAKKKSPKKKHTPAPEK